MNVAVVGCGYVGLVTALGLAGAGHDVVGIEVSGERRDSIAAGRAPFHEPGLEELLAETLASGRFRVAGDIAEIAQADVVLLAVQTPPTSDGANDLSYLREAAEQVATVIASDGGRRRVVAVRSTVVPGTLATVVRPALPAEVAIASNPEFLREGSAVSDFRNPDRIVIGCDEDWGRERLGELYAPLDAPVVFTTPATAELAKYASNAFLATLISFANEIGRISESLPGVDVEDVLGILHRDRRLSPEVNGQTVRPAILSYLKAGCGYGGSCLPKDLSALLATRSRDGFDHPLLDAVRAINETQPVLLVDRLEAALLGLGGRSVAVLGLAFKGGTDDLRESPGLRIVDLLLERGVIVTAYDPLVTVDSLSSYVGRGLRVESTLDAAIVDAEACVVATNAEEFGALAELVRARDGSAPLVVDGRRALAPDSFAGGYIGVGRQSQ